MLLDSTKHADPNMDMSKPEFSKHSNTGFSYTDRVTTLFESLIKIKKKIKTIDYCYNPNTLAHIEYYLVRILIVVINLTPDLKIERRINVR